MSPLEWVDDLPPDSRRGPAPAYGREVEDEVRANSGRWAKVWTYPAKTTSGKWATNAASAAAAARKRGFDTAVRATEDKTGRDLYLRWPAENAPAAPKAQPGRRAVGYPCDHCEEEMDTPAALKVHVRRHHPEQVA